jgi:hypothetical protein
MSTRQKKKVSFKDIQNVDEKVDQIQQFDYNINFLVLKYKSYIKTIEKDTIYLNSDLSRHEMEYQLDVIRYWNEMYEHFAYVESKIAEMEYHIALHIQKNEPRVEKKKEKNKLIIENEYKHIEYHRLKINVHISDVYCSLIYHKVQNYSKISKLLNNLHSEMKNEYVEIQKLFDESKCELREEWQEYIKPFIDQMFDIYNRKEMYNNYLNMFTAEKIKSNEYYFNNMKELKEYKF